MTVWELRAILTLDHVWSIVENFQLQQPLFNFIINSGVGSIIVNSYVSGEIMEMDEVFMADHIIDIMGRGTCETFSYVFSSSFSVKDPNPP